MFVSGGLWNQVPEQLANSRNKKYGTTSVYSLTINYFFRSKWYRSWCYIFQILTSVWHQHF